MQTICRFMALYVIFCGNCPFSALQMHTKIKLLVELLFQDISMTPTGTTLRRIDLLRYTDEIIA